MESETLKLLRKRKADLKKQEKRLRAELDPVVAELDQVEIAIRSLTAKPAPPAKTPARKSAKSTARASARKPARKATQKPAKKPGPKAVSTAGTQPPASVRARKPKPKAKPGFEKLTCQELVMRALTGELQEGATTAEMLEFFEKEWGREIKRGSLSPQLTRLKKEGKIAALGKVWMTSDKFDEQFSLAVEEVARNVFENEKEK